MNAIAQNRKEKRKREKEKERGRGWRVRHGGGEIREGDNSFSSAQSLRFSFWEWGKGSEGGEDNKSKEHWSAVFCIKIKVKNIIHISIITVCNVYTLADFFFFIHQPSFKQTDTLKLSGKENNSMPKDKCWCSPLLICVVNRLALVITFLMGLILHTKLCP